jgi:hypothetical protein
LHKGTFEGLPYLETTTVVLSSFTQFFVEFHVKVVQIWYKLLRA